MTGIKSVDRAELLALIHALLLAATYAEARVYADSSYVVSVWNKSNTKVNEANWDLCRITSEIKEQARARGQTISVMKVYSHALDHPDPVERSRRKKWMTDEFQERWSEIAEGNRQADLLAKNGHRGIIFPLPPAPVLEKTTYWR